MKMNLSSLNANQLAAVTWRNGPLLVLAGPGSGKTRVLTYHIATVIEDSPEARFRVLGITFTNKAATEMRQRVDGLLAVGRDRAVLTTFHSFAAETLRQHGSHLGLKPDFSILTEPADREAVMADAIKSASLGWDDFTPTAAQVLPLVNRMLDECVRVGAAKEWMGSRPHAAEIAQSVRWLPSIVGTGQPIGLSISARDGCRPSGNEASSCETSAPRVFSRVRRRVSRHERCAVSPADTTGRRVRAEPVCGGRRRPNHLSMERCEPCEGPRHPRQVPRCLSFNCQRTFDARPTSLRLQMS